MAPSPSTLKWRVLAGYFLSYMFDAVDILILAIAMPAISASLQIGPMQAGLLATATLLGMRRAAWSWGRWPTAGAAARCCCCRWAASAR
ncbi:hypothetical protein WJ968_34350 [Achromobacter xylosoxidans]